MNPWIPPFFPVIFPPERLRMDRMDRIRLSALALLGPSSFFQRRTFEGVRRGSFSGGDKRTPEKNPKDGIVYTDFSWEFDVFLICDDFLCFF